MMNDQSAITAFERQLVSFGMETSASIRPNGELVRCWIRGDKTGTLNGYYVLNRAADRLWGAYGSWRTGERQAWSSVFPKCSLTNAQAHQFQPDLPTPMGTTSASDVKTIAHHRAMLARWLKAREASADHPYLLRKRVKPYGIRQEGSRLLVPMRKCVRLKKIVGIQQIDESGEKRNMRGSQPSGAFHMIGDPVPGEAIIIAEGFATAASLHEWSALPVAVSFGKQNLRSAGETIQSYYPDCEFIIAADVDEGLIPAEAKAAAAFLDAELLDPRDYISGEASRGLQ